MNQTARPIDDLRRQAHVAVEHLAEAARERQRAVGFGSCNTGSRTRALVYAGQCHTKAALHIEEAVKCIRRLVELV